ncbi:MAG: peptidylprolyl isomerase [Phycisphaerae bacterium]
MQKLTRTLVAAATLVAVALIGGCPLDSIITPQGNASNTNSSGTTISVETTGIVDPGDTVSLTARVTGEYSPTQYTYRWYQTYGRRIELSSVTAAAPTFVAPEVAEDTSVIFRVDILDPSGKLYRSEEITIQIEGTGATGNSNSNSGTDTGGKVRVRMVTSLGDIVVDLDRQNAPISVDNFLQYADDGYYENTIFHRVIPGFVVQGGGFTADLTQKPTRAAIVNESTNGLKNLRGTIAMARTNEPNSATSQVYFNLKDNSSLDRTGSNPGYAVFGAIVEGLSVIDAIAAVETGTENGQSDVPVNDVFILRVDRE